MTDDQNDTSMVDNNAEQWTCVNCGNRNESTEEHCGGCGYVKGYDPEAPLDIDFSHVQETIKLQDEQRRQRLHYIIEFTKIGLLLIIAVFFLMLFSRLTSDWPFMGAYERDAESFSTAVLAVESRLTLGVNKADYDILVASALEEMIRFKIKYSESPRRHSTSYTKLIQAAEYYQIANDAWDHQLLSNSNSGRIDPNADSQEAEESIQSLWHTASTNLMAALEDMR